MTQERDVISELYQRRLRNLVIGMDSVIRFMNDGEMLDTWLAMGAPDGSTKEDIEEYVKDDEFMADCGYAFLATMADVLKSDDPIYTLTGVHGEKYGFKFNKETFDFEKE